MKRRKSKGKSPLIRLVGLEVVAAVAATGMVGPPAMAAPGDLDPSFGDVGRRSYIERPLYSSLLSVDVDDDDSVMFGGGGGYCYYDCYEDYFVGRLLPDGTPDPGFAVATLQRSVVYDTALQADGKVVGAGFARKPDGDLDLQVFRLRPDGALDPDFGLGGLVLVSDGTVGADIATSVIVDPDGRIVVAGRRGSNLMVVRLLPNGSLDATFGSGGIYITTDGGGWGARIARVSGGGYRVLSPNANGGASDCKVFGLTDAGTLDAAFGSAGIAIAPSTGGQPDYCSSLAIQPDGNILIGGVRDNHAYLSRLLATGMTDLGFSGDNVSNLLASTSALGVGPAGSIFVAGNDSAPFSGALVVRLLADGTVDAGYGRSGLARLDIGARRVGYPTVSDLKVLGNNSVIVAGNSYDYDFNTNSYYSFVARLLGNGAGGSPGVLSMTQARILATEQGGRAVLSVRRTGGSTGAVAVRYFAHDFEITDFLAPSNSPGETATSGADYTAVADRLTWADGDTSEREIEIPIASDTIGESPEWFEVALDSPEGGAGLGATGIDVEIAGASYPFGDFTIESTVSSTVVEGAGTGFNVYRNFYGQGVASVTVRLAAGGTATLNQDFTKGDGTNWQDVVVTFGDGETGAIYVPVRIVTDGKKEPTETFTLELVAPTGGAMLGAKTQASMTIEDPPGPVPSSKSGGGSFGGLGALLLGMAGILRRRRSANR